MTLWESGPHLYGNLRLRALGSTRPHSKPHSQSMLARRIFIKPPLSYQIPRLSNRLTRNNTTALLSLPIHHQRTMSTEIKTFNTPKSAQRK